MNKAVKISSIFPKYLFWDLDYDKLDLIKDMDIIIPRALFATTKETFNNDILRLEEYYSNDNIIKYLKCTKERISNEVCLMVSKRYNIDVFSRFKI